MNSDSMRQHRTNARRARTSVTAPKAPDAATKDAPVTVNVTVLNGSQASDDNTLVSEFVFS
jgi:hypothetical protein